MINSFWEMLIVTRLWISKSKYLKGYLIYSFGAQEKAQIELCKSFENSWYVKPVHCSWDGV